MSEIPPVEGKTDKESTENQQMTEWECGDVYEDLRNLENAIHIFQAEDNLARNDRLEMLNATARQKYPVQQTIRRNLLPPLLFSWAVAVSSKIPEISGSAVTKLFGRISCLHFWTIVVGAPIALRMSIRQRDRKNEQEIPFQLQRAGPAYYRFVVESGFGEEDPSLSCSDHALCLTEQWLSAVVGIALGGKLLPTVLRPWCRCATRFAAHASLYQYPKLWFLQTRDTRPRPIPKHEYLLSELTSWLRTPWFLAWDVAHLASGQSWLVMTSGYLFLVSWLLALASRRLPPSTETRERNKGPSKVLRIIGLLGLLSCLISTNSGELTKLIDLAQSRSFLSLVELYATQTSCRAIVLSPIVTAVALFGPLCHLVAFKRLVRFAYTRNLSLALGAEEFKEEMKDHARIMWRWWLKWREPKRMSTAIHNLRAKIFYMLFVSGSTDEFLVKQRTAFLKQENRESDSNIIRRLSKETSSYRTDERLDRSKWKMRAMENLAKIHQANYKSDNIAEDPLGIALHVHFGIGLGFNYDHTTDMKLGDAPSLRRLQARAAKSAIKRAREIYDPKLAQEILQNCANEKERDLKASEMRQQAKAELEFLSKKLADLVPTSTTLKEGIGIYKTTPTVSKFIWDPTSKSYIMWGQPERSPSIERLYMDGNRANFKIDYLNPGGEPTLDSDPDGNAINLQDEQNDGEWDDKGNFRQVYT